MRALIILCAALCCGLSDGQANIETLMDNVLVLRIPDDANSMVTVPLTCGAAYENQPVVWKKNGVLEPTLKGNQVNVVVEEMNGGNFTCHLGAEGEYLNHTVILIQLEPDNRTVILQAKSPKGDHIHCSAPNYGGSFHCTWERTAHRSNAAVLLVKAERHLDKIPCELDGDGSGVRCQDTICPFKEEEHRIILTVYIYSRSRLETYTKTFYMREIVRPEKLPNLRSSDGKLFSWSYPESWEKPCTYFSLQFHVKVVPNRQTCHSTEDIMHNTTDQTQLEINVRAKKYVFCVRAQDKYASGPFSHWSYCTVNREDVQC